ncbi:unnamed protein product, partial [Mesorhabditis spiculigera]
MAVFTNQYLSWFDYLSPLVTVLWFLGVTWFLSMTIIQHCFIDAQPPKQPPFGTIVGRHSFLNKKRRPVGRKKYEGASSEKA